MILVNRKYVKKIDHVVDFSTSKFWTEENKKWEGTIASYKKWEGTITCNLVPNM